jgi:hypothetical protein
MTIAPPSDANAIDSASGSGLAVGGNSSIDSPSCPAVAVATGDSAIVSASANAAGAFVCLSVLGDRSHATAAVSATTTAARRRMFIMVDWSLRCVMCFQAVGRIGVHAVLSMQEFQSSETR